MNLVLLYEKGRGIFVHENTGSGYAKLGCALTGLILGLS